MTATRAALRRRFFAMSARQLAALAALAASTGLALGAQSAVTTPSVTPIGIADVTRQAPVTRDPAPYLKALAGWGMSTAATDTETADVQTAETAEAPPGPPRIAALVEESGIYTIYVSDGANFTRVAPSESYGGFTLISASGSEARVRSPAGELLVLPLFGRLDGGD